MFAQNTIQLTAAARYDDDVYAFEFSRPKNKPVNELSKFLFGQEQLFGKRPFVFIAAIYSEDKRSPDKSAQAVQAKLNASK